MSYIFLSPSPHTPDDSIGVYGVHVNSVAGENDKYQLTVVRYTSDSLAGDALKWHNGMKFSTPDRDNDVLLGEGNGWHGYLCLRWLISEKGWRERDSIQPTLRLEDTVCRARGTEIQRRDRKHKWAGLIWSKFSSMCHNKPSGPFAFKDNNHCWVKGGAFFKYMGCCGMLSLLLSA